MKFPKLSGKAVLAPLAGVSDVAFRTLARKYGAALTYTEFVSSTAVVRGNLKTSVMLRKDPCEKPSAVQVFGSSAEEIVGAAKILSKLFDIIDINCGCPAVKVTKIGAGSSLMKDPEKIGEIVKKVVSEIKNPVTVKIRAGWKTKKNAVETSQIVEKAGASAVAVHGRTYTESYSKPADWKIIKKVKDAVSIPVIGNGDVNSPEMFVKRLEDSGVDYIMIGRAAMSNPYIFRQINDHIKKGKYGRKDGLEQFTEYLSLAKKRKVDFNIVKHHAMRFTKGMPGGASVRRDISMCKSIADIERILSN